ncbi:hypothetical protein [Okeania sp. SIO2B3]|uniref:hypothetical protein n=1 Tax=Okeania sp. SIO2B3 TaxID=2607784 RepID=UPI0013C0FB48|nr:hypothetical protein [Okeania sp. SIO2B3]NET43484.1 hypothetical protein [Okeania sp. SIO2B3]
MNGDGGQYEVIYNVENPNLKSPEKIESKTQPANAENSDLKSPEKPNQKHHLLKNYITKETN